MAKPLATNRTAAKARAYRQRRASGVLVVPIEICLLDMVEALLSTFRLDPVDQENRPAIHRAVQTMVDDWTDDICRVHRSLNDEQRQRLRVTGDGIDSIPRVRSSSNNGDGGEHAGSEGSRGGKRDGRDAA